MPGSGNTLKIFVPINKIDEEQRLVYGTVAAEILDNSGEMFDYEGSKPYFQKWSENADATSGGKSKGNLRVMHTSKVAGVLTDLGFDDDRKVIECCAKVLDDGEWSMVKGGGYTGFSMGGRYVSRATKSDGVKSYIADPVEVSLVDKPCIPTAVFEMVKADGLTETHRFHEDLYQKSDSGETTMYVPTNDEILPVAQRLAKAAGQSETAWVDFVQAATDELVAVHKGEMPAAIQDKIDAKKDKDAKDAKKDDDGGDMEKLDAHDPGTCAEEGCSKCAAMKADGASKADKMSAEDKKKADAKAKADEDAKDGSKDDGSEDKKGNPFAKKSDMPCQQVWRTEDGSLFLKKSDAVSHVEELTKATPQSDLAKSLLATIQDAKAITKGDAPEVKAEPVISETVKTLTKFSDFFKDPAVLAKGMYDVSRLADLIVNMVSLQMCLDNEADREGDNSPIPDKLEDIVAMMAETLIELATEETAELLASMKDDEAGGMDEMAYPTDMMEMACSTTGLQKADLMAKAVSVLVKRDAPPADEVLVKVATLEIANTELLAKSAKLEGELAEITPLIKTLQDQMELIKSMPMSKAPTSSFVAVEKGQGSGQPAQGGRLEDRFSKADLADAAIRMSQQNGHRMVLPTGHGQ